MNRFPKMDFSKMTFPKFDPSTFGKADPARAAKMAAMMAKLQKQQAAAYAKWAEARSAAAGAESPSAAGIETIDLVAPTAPGGAWTAPPDVAGRDPKKPEFNAAQGETLGADIAGNVMRVIQEALATANIGGGLGAGFGGVPGTTVPAANPVPEGARFETRAFSNAVGTRTYKVYVPSGYTGQALPVVVMLHGCTQNPDDFARGTRMNELAEEQTFLVAYPEQPRSANMQRCWNWYEPGDQTREGGEPALIAGIVGQVIEEFSADRSRVYAAGLSAGGAAAAILAATYPDLFAAVGVHSGLACGSARDVPTAFAAMKGNGVVAAKRNRHVVPTIVFHGDRDGTVHHANGDQVIAQATPVPTLNRTVREDRTPDGVAYTCTVQRDPSGRAILEQWILHGAGHAWSGGDPAGSFTDARGPDASREMMRFFLAHANAAGSVRH